MVEIEGKYQLVEALNSEEILKIAEQEVTDKSLEQLNSKNSSLTVQVDGDSYTFSSIIGDNWRREIRFTLGEPFIEGTIGVKNKTETTVTKVDNKLIFTCSSATKRIERLYEFTDSGVTLVLDIGSEVQAKRIYKRV